MSDDDFVIELTDEDMTRIYNRVMDSVPYDTPGALRDAVFAGGPMCCPNCFDWHHPHVDAWREMETWLALSGEDWRTVE